MNRILAAAALASLGVTAFGDSLLPVQGVATYRLDIHTGEYWPTPDGPGPRFGPHIAWDRNTEWRGFIPADGEFLDWGDVGTPDVPVVVNGFRFSYCTNGVAPVALTVAFYVNENGNNTNDVTTVAQFNLSSLPGRDGETNCFQFDVDLPDPVFDQFSLAGNDRDQDGLVDFGYGLIIVNCECAGQAGPLVADGPINTSPGSTNQYDVFDPPKWAGGDYIRTDTGPAGTLGQLAMRIYTDTGEGCPQPGCDDGGIDVDLDGNCIVNLSDLTQLLAGFGTPSGATNEQGDVDGDGDVDLTDLTNLLARFGNMCD